MMFITISVIPWMHAYYSPSDLEMKGWDAVFRFITRQKQHNPYEKWERPTNELYNFFLFWWYVFFSPVTHVYTQVKVHNRHGLK